MNDENKQKGNFWKGLKGKIILITVIVGGVAAFIGNIQKIAGFFSSMFSEKKISITGIVLNNDKTPAENAHVTIYLSHKTTDSIITFSNKEGGFSFKNLSKSKYDSFAISISWKGKKASYKNGFSETNFGKDIIITLSNTILPENSNPLSFTYFDLKGHIIDFLLEGKVNPDWEVRLSKHPYIITNEIFNVIKDLRKKFNYEAFTIGAEGTTIPTYLTKNGRKNEIKINKAPAYYMVNSEDEGNDNAYIQIDENDVSLFIKDANTKKKLKANKSSFRWFPSREQLIDIKKAELRKLKRQNFGEDFPDDNNKLLNLLLNITESYYPDRFMEASIYFDDNPCSDGWIVEITPPSLLLKIVLLENPTSQTLTLGKFFVKENKNSMKLSIANSDSAGEPVPRNYFPKEKLKPSETIVLPLQLTVENSLKQQYAFGGSQLLQSVEINNDFYAVRKASSEDILMYDGGAGVGSCPYVYSFSKNENEWLLENHILYGFRSKGKEQEHTLPLKRFTGQLQIREIDPETSYIDYLYIKHILPNGEIKILNPDNSSLAKKDGNYVTLKKGDKLLLNFPAEENTKGLYSVISFGYYVPNK